MPKLHTACYVSAFTQRVREIKNVTHTEYKAEGLNGGVLYLHKHEGGCMILPLHTVLSGIELDVQDEI